MNGSEVMTTNMLSSRQLMTYATCFNIVYKINILPETLVGLQLGYESQLQNIGGFKVCVSVRDHNMYSIYFSHLLSVHLSPDLLSSGSPHYRFSLTPVNIL